MYGIQQPAFSAPLIVFKDIPKYDRFSEFSKSLFIDKSYWRLANVSNLRLRGFS